MLRLKREEEKRKMINLIYTILPIVTLIIGFYFGFNLKKTNELPEIKTPVKIIEEKKEQAQIKQKQNELETYMQNIDNYPNNQKDFK